jgi:uncharacterized protein (TIGR02391 family)
VLTFSKKFIREGREYMGKRSPPAPEKRPANLSPEQMRAGLKQLDRREADLKVFDVNTIRDHGDQNAEALRLQYNATIAKVFGGKDTIEYERFSSGVFDRGPIYFVYEGGGVNVAEVRQGYREGIDEALSHIATIRKLFQEELEDAEEDPTARITRAFGELDIHPEIAAASGRLVEDAHYAEAVENACKALEVVVQRRSGIADKSGTPLMQSVFGGATPVLKVADLGTQTGRDEQQGMAFMFAGAMLGLRNPRAHSLRADEPERAIEYIAFISMLAKVADAASR